MFDLPVNNLSAEDNSFLNIGKKEKIMDPLKNNMANCTTVLTGMSHEMRTYMNAIVAFSFLMKDNGCNNTDREDFSNQILHSCEQLITLFDSFLDSAMIDTGSSKADSRIFKLDTLLDDLISEFREMLNKEDQKNLELVTEMQFSSSIEIMIDKNKVFRVIRSLFQNAVKNTKSGYIKIGYFMNEDKVTFYVLDSGQGYFKSKEFLQTEDLNESLLLHNDTYTAVNITLAKKLIQMLGGTVWIECNGLSGSAIYFSIPSRMVSSSEVKIDKYVKNMIAI